MKNNWFLCTTDRCFHLLIHCCFIWSVFRSNESHKAFSMPFAILPIVLSMRMHLKHFFRVQRSYVGFVGWHANCLPVRFWACIMCQFKFLIQNGGIRLVSVFVFLATAFIWEFNMLPVIVICKYYNYKLLVFIAPECSIELQFTIVYLISEYFIWLCNG